MIKSLLCFSLFLLTAQGFAADWSSKVEGIIKKEIKDIDTKKSQYGIWIKKGDQITTLNADQKLTPASLSKIPTALAFLEKQPLSEKFKTWIYHTGKIQKGELKGDLYLKGGGDPTFVTESMWLMINELKRNDINKISGNLYVDETFFDQDYYSKGRQQRRVDRAYDAPVSALSFNWNSLSIYVRPGKNSGDEARVYVDPELPNIVIKNKAKTTGHSKTELKVTRKIKNGKIIVDVKGKISTSKDEKAFYKSIGDAALWTGDTFKMLLNQSGISYKGDVTKKKTPDNAKMLVEYDGWSMPRVLAALSKFSNNFVAEMLTKHLGKKETQPGNIKDGLVEIRNYLNKSGWQQEEFTFENPSGFTRKNKMRADRLGELLYGARNDFTSSPEFLSSLPISGVDGTLKTRMKHALKSKVRAKTGYMSGIVGLAGYLESPKKGEEPITFVFLYNGPYKKDWDVRAMYGRLLWKIYQIK